MELGIISDEISLDLEEAFRLGEELGFRKYEIRCFDDYEHRIPNLFPGRIDRLKELVDNGTIEVTAITPGTFKIKPDETDQLRKELEEILPRTCELARELKAPTIITFGFMSSPGVGNEEVVRRIREAGQIVGEFQLQLAVENEPGSYCDTGARTADVVKAVDLPHVGINWDPANAEVSGEAAYPLGYEAIKPWLLNVHIKDAIHVPPDQWENRLIGDGAVNWLGQMRSLLRDKPVRHLTLETHVFPLLQSTKEDLRRLRILFEHARQLGNIPE
ncbi:MAG: sugar phosphate isomerase/epimerase [Verrucomicrobiae bacterium]|nr:sugar phosphate isomerase/epimerase [Verrucomicrobiae bacterium]